MICQRSDSPEHWTTATSSSTQKPRDQTGHILHRMCDESNVLEMVIDGDGGDDEGAGDD